MKTTVNKALKLVEGGDIVDLENILNPNFTTIDTAIKANEDNISSAKTDITNLKAAPTRVIPTLLNGWEDNSTSYPSHFTKDSTGTVNVYLYLKNGATAINVVPCTLPVGYRPQTSMTLRGYGDPGVEIIWHITSSGEIKFLRAFTLTTGNFILLTHSFKAVN